VEGSTPDFASTDLEKRDYNPGSSEFTQIITTLCLYIIRGEFRNVQSTLDMKPFLRSSDFSVLTFRDEI